MTEWQTMDTAPLEVIVLMKQGMRFHAGFMHRNKQYGTVTAQIISRADGRYSSAKMAGFVPDMWMPLPPPPKEPG